MQSKIESIVATAALNSVARNEAVRVAIQLVVWVDACERGHLPESLCPANRWSVQGAVEQLRETEFSFLAPGRETVESLGDTLLEMWDVVDNMVRSGAFTDADCDLGALWTEQGGGPVLTEGMADLLTTLARVNGKDSVYCGWDHSAQLACRLAAQTVGRVVTESPESVCARELVRLWRLGRGGSNFEISRGHPITKPGLIEASAPVRFHRALAFPPLGVRYSASVAKNDWLKRFPERSNAGAVLDVRQLLSHTKGRAVIAVPNVLLFSGGGEQKLRQSLLEAGSIKAVISMAEGLLSHTSVGFSILVLELDRQHDRVRFIDASDADDAKFYGKDAESGRRGRLRLRNTDRLAALVDSDLTEDDESIVSEVAVPEILSRESELTVTRYVLSGTQKRLQKLLDTRATVALRDVATVLRPNRKFESVDGAAPGVIVHEIGATDMPPFGPIRSPQKSVRLSADSVSQYEDDFLRANDIVLVIKGSAGKIGLVPEDVPPPGEGGWILSQAAVCLRVDAPDDLSPVSLFSMLRSEVGQALIERIIAGATIRLIRLSDLESLPIFKASPEEQRRDEDLYRREIRIQREIERLRAEQKSLVRSAWSL